VPVVDAVLVVAMVGLSGYGALRLPPDAQVPVHFGPWSSHTAVPKTPGLVLWVAVGLVTYLAAGILGARGADASARAGLTLALATILVTQAVAVGLAVAHSRRT
jgi:amino acid transporter